MIQIDNLEFRYRQSEFCLRIADFSIRRRARVAVIGPSGSGKTTLLNLIAGNALPLNGRVVTDDVEVSAMSDTARRDFRIRRIGLVFQEFELVEHLTVLDNILLPCRISPALRLDQTTREHARMLAARMGIEGKLRRYVRRLSQGERQRVAVCRALLPEPPLLLCDEPTGNLDPVNKDHVLDVLFDYVEWKQTTLLTVTHDHDVLGRFDEVVDFKQFHHWDAPAK